MIDVIALLFSISVLMGILTLVVLVRLWLKRTRGFFLRVEAPGIVTLILLAISFSLLGGAVAWGYGRHGADLAADLAADKALRLVAVSAFFASIAVTTARASALTSLVEVLPVDWATTALLTLTGLTFCLNLAVALMIVIVPWGDRMLKECESDSSVWFGIVVQMGAVLTVCLDFGMAAIAGIKGWRLCITHGQLVERIGFVVGMSFGICAITISIMKLAQTTCASFTYDSTYTTIPFAILTFAEPVTIMLAAVVPILRLYFTKPTHTLRGKPLGEDVADPWPYAEGPVAARRGSTGRSCSRCGKCLYLERRQPLDSSTPYRGGGAC
ncbi:hypothetical protein VTJ49DRAFT_1439 [Mycothermus thermophilus]|uniref:Rhodopsin domain-containing protein n=1 Tax=Humicola insolens TaxID=85995 RepID=A0ABR3VDM6_HUMIN